MDLVCKSGVAAFICTTSAVATPPAVKPIAPPPAPIVAVLAQPAKAGGALKLAPIVVGFEHGTDLGTVSGGELCVGHRKITWTDTEKTNHLTKVMDSTLRARVEKLGFSVPDSPTDLFGEVKDDSRYTLGGIVERISMNLCYPRAGFGNLTKSSGTVSVAMTWKIFSREQHKVVATIQSEATDEEPHRVVGEATTILTKAFDKTVDQLMADPAFKQIAPTPS